MQPETALAGDWLDSLLGKENGQPAPAVAHTDTTLVRGGTDNEPPAQSRTQLIPEAFQLPMDEPAAGDAPVPANHAVPGTAAGTRSGGTVPIVRRILRRQIVLVIAICGMLAGAACLVRYHGTATKAADQAAREEREPVTDSKVPVTEQRPTGEGQESAATKPTQSSPQPPSDSPAGTDVSTHEPTPPTSSGADPQAVQPAEPEPPSAIPAVNQSVSGETQPGPSTTDAGEIAHRLAGIALYNVAPEALVGLGLRPGAVVATARRPESESEVGQVLQVDDVITRVGEREVRCTGDLLAALAEIKSGQTAQVEVDRYPRLWLRTQLGLPTTSAAEESERARSAIVWRFLGRSGKDIALSLSLSVEFK